MGLIKIVDACLGIGPGDEPIDGFMTLRLKRALL